MSNIRNSTTINDVLNLYKDKKYKLYNGYLDINIFGIRNIFGEQNKFDDAIGILFNISRTREDWQMFVCDATTDPGTYHLNNPGRVEGTAILCPGQYKQSFSFGLHKGQYECLVQIKPVKVYRDNNRNDVLDFINEKDTFSGIQIHRANSSKKSTQVDKWSAGCQVIADPLDFKEFMNITNDSAKLYGDKFTYTLFED